MTLAEMIRQLKTAESISTDATVRVRLNDVDRDVKSLWVVRNTVLIVSE